MTLSGLTAEELDALGGVWPDIDAERRRDLLERLREMSEDNLDADFNDLFRFCLGDEHPDVKAKAIEGLWECDDRTLVTPLTALLARDPSEKVRATAAMALGKFAALAQTGKMLSKDGDRIKESLLQVIGDHREDREVRKRAIEAVAPFNTPDVQQIIQDAYRSDQIEMRCSAVYAMGKSCDPAWLPVILKELSNSDPAMRYEASNACGELGEEPAVPHLIPLFEDDDQQTQTSAIIAVGVIGGSLARKALLRCLKSSDELVVEVAQEAFGHLEAVEGSSGFNSDP
jgi:HEAT repeat protein